MDRAKWHFGYGPQFCQGCRDCGDPCSKGLPNDEGKHCPYVETLPHSIVEWQAWDVVVRGWKQLRTAATMSKVYVMGFDMPALIQISDALGYDTDKIVDMLAPLEIGMLNGKAEVEGS